MKKMKRIGIIAISSLLAITLCSCEMFDGLFDVSSSEASTTSQNDNSGSKIDNSNSDSQNNSQSDNQNNSHSDNPRVPEITFNDGNLTIDAQGNYCLTRIGGQSYTFRCGYNNAPNGFSITYSLPNQSDAQYCSITPDGVLATKDDFYGTKVVTILVQMFSADGNVLASATILVTIVNPDAPPALSEFKVTSNKSEEQLSENSVLSLYIGDSISFTLTLDNAPVNGNITVDSQYATVEGNTVTAIKEGSPNIVFSAKDNLNRDYSLTAKLSIAKNSLAEIYAANEGDDFFILNNELIFNADLVAKYANGTEIEISRDDANLSYSIGDVTNETYKNVTFSYAVDGVSKTVTYPVLFSNPVSLSKKDLGFNYKQYGLNIGGVGSGYNYVNSTGNINALVMPVWFINSSQFFADTQKDQLIEDINTVAFSENARTVHCSLKEYYAQASHGKLNIDGYITDFYESNRRTNDFSDEESNTVYNFGKEAMEWYVSNYHDRPISDYDADGNGKVDVAIFLFAGNYYGSGSNTNSYAFNVVFAKNDAGVGVHTYLDSCIFMPIGAFYGYEFKDAGRTGQKNIDDLSAKNADAFLSASSTLIHEMGHSLGCVDLYTQNGHSRLHQEGGYEPTGDSTIMNSAFEGMDPFESNVLSWTKPYVLKADDYEIGQSFDVQIDDFQTSGDNIILTPSWNAKDSPFDEYMQLELFATNGLNAHSANIMNDVGIRLWHINAALEKNNNGQTGYFPDDGGTSMIASNHLETEEDYNIVHLIRNNKDEEYKSSKIFSGEDLFKSGDSFVFEDFETQFKKGPMFDNRERLGWSFSVKSIFQKQDGSYSCVLTLTRVDKTIINFLAESNFEKTFTQPEGNGADYAADVFGSDDDLSLVYNFNDSTEPSYYVQGSPISYKGLCLFGSTSGNGGSLVISIKNKPGKQVLIKKVTITFDALTNASSNFKGFVNGEEVTPTKFTGPMNQYSENNDYGRIFEVNAQTITLQNQFTGELNHVSMIDITSIAVDYSIV